MGDTGRNDHCVVPRDEGTRCADRHHALPVHTDQDYCFTGPTGAFTFVPCCVLKVPGLRHGQEPQQR